ncbi:hypothetical protein GQ607_003207 [Colletotrichum asianum]|uniref:Uncharacterized protein n=1 Tax=Colletotrichum asianum TaxID=702518 RepID=A0A8H3WLS4_9PEZI|nr:hypothetical protein GQ607_003207 [Colletotrichum asianum]
MPPSRRPQADHPPRPHDQPQRQHKPDHDTLTSKPAYPTFRPKKGKPMGPAQTCAIAVPPNGHPLRAATTSSSHLISQEQTPRSHTRSAGGVNPQARSHHPHQHQTSDPSTRHEPNAAYIATLLKRRTSCMRHVADSTYTRTHIHLTNAPRNQHLRRNRRGHHT